MDPLNPTAARTAPATAEGARTDSRAVFGEVMGLVGLTCGFAALGAYIGRDLTGLTVLVPWLVGFACLFALNAAAARGAQTLAITLLFVVGLALGIAIGNTVHVYATTQPDAVYQAAGATGLFVGGLGAAGYATRRDLSFLYRGLFFALLALIGFGLLTLFISIPAANVIYCVAGLAIFGLYTVVDFNRLRRAGKTETVPLAAGIFLDVLNVFLFFLSLFGGRN
jgi:FtsH-binding integral membrane protein